MEKNKIIDNIYPCSAAKIFRVDKTSYMHKNIEISANNIINDINKEYYLIDKKSIIKSILQICWYNLKVELSKLKNVKRGLKNLKIK